MEQFFEQMRHSMAESWPETWDDVQAPALPGVGSFDGNVSLEPEEDGYVVLADLPGFEREEIEVTFADDRLTIAGTHEAGEGESYRSRHVHESVRIPGEIVVDDAEATYSNGVLEILLPYSEESADRHTITVE
jgi:HSP20 family protein